jgi:hypothetical protein
MLDRNEALGLGSGATCSNQQIGDTPQHDGSQASEPLVNQRPIIVQTASLVRHSVAGNESIQGAPNQIPSSKSHLGRLVDAIQKSRRLQVALAHRRSLHLVEGRDK